MRTLRSQASACLAPDRRVCIKTLYILGRCCGWKIHSLTHGKEEGTRITSRHWDFDEHIFFVQVWGLGYIKRIAALGGLNSF